MDNKKKPTNAQLQKRIANAIVMVEKTHDTLSVFYSDKGLRLTVNEEYVVIETGFHRHVFSSVTGEGVSRPYLYTKRIIEITHENDCVVDGGLSYQRLLQVLKEKEDQNDYNVVMYYEWWLMNIFVPLYSIGENEVETFMVYFDYMHNIARNKILLDEHKDGLTNKQFVKEFVDLIQEFTKDINEYQIFVPKTNEQVMQENIDAIQQFENDKVMQEQIQNEKEND